MLRPISHSKITLRRSTSLPTGDPAPLNPQSAIRNPQCPRLDPKSEIQNPKFPAAFTMVELLIVIGIIVVLVSIAFGAFRYVRNASAERATRVALTNLNGMLGEFDAQSHFASSVPIWMWWAATTTSSSVTAGQTVPTAAGLQKSADFWKFPFSQGYDKNGTAIADSLDAPGDVSSRDPGVPSWDSRNASYAVLNTQLAMQRLAAIPGNRTAINALPDSAKMLPTYTGDSVYRAVTTTGYLKDNGTDVTTAAAYPPGIHVLYTTSTNQKSYAILGMGTLTPSSANPASGPPWTDEGTAPTGAPLLLDGWSNPILYVPASGLRVKLLNGKDHYFPAVNSAESDDSTQYFIIVSPEGHVTGNGGSTPYVDKPGRPFFASAGPDGDFTKGDDNIYSFNP